MSTLMKFDNLIIAKAAFAEIAKQFPNLSMFENTEDLVELSITMPIQPGLKYKILLLLQNEDELHFCVNNFQLEWFPCKDKNIVEDFVKAVSEFIAGETRILEHYRGRQCVKSQLQHRENKSWRTIGTCMGLNWPIPWRKTYKVLRND